MTTMQRQRLNDYMQRLAYRQRMAKRILILLAIAGLAFFTAACLTSCSSPPSALRSPPSAIQTEFPKLTEPEKEAFRFLNQ